MKLDDVHRYSSISPDYPAHGESMKALARLVLVVAGLVMLLSITPSWGQPVCVAPGCNPTTSDANSNTAGGSAVLLFVGGGGNTAFGANALRFTDTGTVNTAI